MTKYDHRAVMLHSGEQGEGNKPVEREPLHRGATSMQNKAFKGPPNKESAGEDELPELTSEDQQAVESAAGPEKEERREAERHLIAAIRESLDRAKREAQGEVGRELKLLKNSVHPLFDHLVDRYDRAITSYLMRRWGFTRDDAEDLMLEVWLRAWRYTYAHADKITDIGPLLFRAAKQVAIDLLRRRANAPPTISLEQVGEDRHGATTLREIPDEAVRVANEAIGSVEGNLPDWLVRLIGKVCPPRRSLFSQYAVEVIDRRSEGESWQEIAEKLVALDIDQTGGRFCRVEKHLQRVATSHDWHGSDFETILTWLQKSRDALGLTDRLPPMVSPGEALANIEGWHRDYHYLVDRIERNLRVQYSDWRKAVRNRILDDQEERNQFHWVINDAIKHASLSQHHHTVLRLHWEEDQPFSGIAAELNASGEIVQAIYQEMQEVFAKAELQPFYHADGQLQMTPQHVRAIYDDARGIIKDYWSADDKSSEEE